MVETFRFGPLYFDLDLVRRHIAANDVRHTAGQMDITEWATKMLALDRAKPDARPHSFFLGINHDHLPTITEERLREPIYVATVKLGRGKDSTVTQLVIDGNHRVAKAYMAGCDSLPALLFDLTNTKRLQGPVRAKVPR